MLFEKKSFTISQKYVNIKHNLTVRRGEIECLIVSKKLKKIVGGHC